MIRHHPSPELLLDYAAGGLPKGPSLVIASHIELCRSCRRQVAEFEAVGGALLETVAPAPVADSALEAVLARLEENKPSRARPAVRLDAETTALIPSPLRPYLPASLRNLVWRGVRSLAQEAKLVRTASGGSVSLVRLGAGMLTPPHTHQGREYTLVLAGGYTEHGKPFRRGDFDVGDPSDRHQPVADDNEGCLCLVVLDAPLRFTGPLGRLVNPFLRL